MGHRLAGTLLSLGLTGLLAVLATGAVRITGLSSEILPVVQQSAPEVSVSGLVLCGVIIGALGVLNDVTVAQASAVWEPAAGDPRVSRLDLFRSAMRIGRDHIASSVYTLLLAYAGSAIPLLLLVSLSGRSVHCWPAVVRGRREVPYGLARTDMTAARRELAGSGGNGGRWSSYGWCCVQPSRFPSSTRRPNCAASQRWVSRREARAGGPARRFRSTARRRRGGKNALR